MNRPN